MGWRPCKTLLGRWALRLKNLNEWLTCAARLLDRYPFRRTSDGLASPWNGQTGTCGWMITARSKPSKREAGAALRNTVASQLLKALWGSRIGPTTEPGIEKRPDEEARKNASVCAATLSVSAGVNGAC